jgi:hypothetical protein
MIQTCEKCNKPYEAIHTNRKYCDICRLIVRRHTIAKCKRRHADRYRITSRIYNAKYRKEHAKEIKEYARSDVYRGQHEKYLKNHPEERKATWYKYNHKPNVKLAHNDYYRQNTVSINGTIYNVNTCPEEIRGAVAVALFLKRHRNVLR